MNIAILIWQLNGGGAEKVASLLSVELSKKHNVYLFLGDTKNIGFKYKGEIVNVGENFFIEDLIYYKKKYNIDCSISFLKSINLVNIKSRVNDKIIVSIRNKPSYANDIDVLKSDLKYYKYADKIVACAYGVNYDLEKNLGVKLNLDVIYNFLNKEDVKKLGNLDLVKENNENLKKSSYFIAVGRFDKVKNYERLVKQFIYFHKNYNSNIKLLIIGSYRDLKIKLEKLIKENNMEDYIIMKDHSDNPFSYIKRAKALIVSSKSEGLPNVILEAMTLNTPVISTDCISGPRELLDDIRDYSVKLNEIHLGKRGILVSNNESEDNLRTHFMADAMEKIIKDKSYVEKIKVNEKQYIENYSNEEILNKWMNLIENTEKKEMSKSLFEKEYEKLEVAKNIFIYGAGKMGKKLYLKLKNKYKITGFVVSNKGGNVEKLYELPVFSYEEVMKNYDFPTFIIGASFKNNEEIHKILINSGIEDERIVIFN